MECVLLASLGTGHCTQHICVRASRVWHYRGGLGDGEVQNIHMVLIDEQGESMYAVVPAALVSTHIHKLHETAIYRLSPRDTLARFTFPNLCLRLSRESPFVLPVLHSDDVFPEWTYKLTSFHELPAPNNTSTRFLDVVGIIRAISDVGTCSMPGASVLLFKRQVVLADSSGNELKVNLWGEAAWRFNGQAIRFLGQEETAVVIFVGMTVHLCDGSKELSGAAASRWYINEDMQDINILRIGVQSSFEPIARIQIPRYEILQSEGHDRYPKKSLSAILTEDFLQNQNRLVRCSVQIWRLTPGQPWCVAACAQCRSLAAPAASSSTQPDRYMCSNPDCHGTDASLEYRLHLIGSDDMGEAEFTLSQRAAQSVIGISPRQVILNNHRSVVPITNLAFAATQIIQTPPEVARVACSRYNFLLHIPTNNFNGRWASFNVHTVEAWYPPE